MKILLNGTDREVPDGASIAVVLALVTTGGTKVRGVAVAVNDQVVPRSAWQVWALHDGDVVEALTAAPGG